MIERDGRLIQNDADDLVSAEVPGLTEDGFSARVVQVGVEGVFPARGGPAGEGAGDFADVLLAVVSLAQAKPLFVPTRKTCISYHNHDLSSNTLSG